MPRRDPRLHEANDARGLELVGVSIDGRTEGEAVRSFIGEYGVTYTIWRDDADAIGFRFGLVGVPITFLIDQRGRLQWQHFGPLDADDPALTEALEAALADQS